MCVCTRVFPVYASKMANRKSSVSVGADGGVVGASVPGAQKVIPMEVDQDVGLVITLGKPGLSG